MDNSALQRNQINEFIERWKSSGGSEHANYQLFLVELTELLGLPRPNPATDNNDNDDYRFERPVKFTHTSRTSAGFIDLYRSGCFILETKQGVNAKTTKQADLSKGTPAPKQTRIGHGVRGTAAWDDTMLKARNQADNYARAVSKEDGWPPFLIIVDVGHVIELYADFSGQGHGYNQFPDGNGFRIYLDDLHKDETLDLLRTIWTDPKSLDPSLRAAQVTRDIAAHLAELGKSFEAQGHDSETVARFLMRCLFSMFAEDVELIPKDSFVDLLRKLRGHSQDAEPALAGLWEAMDKGKFAHALMTKVKKFNGGLFKDSTALPLNDLQLDLLIEAAEADWKLVEPAIFGTLLERALDKRQRHKLGAHYTPRAYVERLVTPTVMEPLREDWRDVQTAVQRLTEDGKKDEALKLVRSFHTQLCEIRVLDPACGSGNFLYVALEMMKRLEGEVTLLLAELGEQQINYLTVDPHQFLGIELNPWAANVAELVLWIGYLQWHFRTHGTAAPSEPVLRDFKNIKNADALLEWSDRTPRMDAEGKPVTRWDGVTTLGHPVTGEEVPDPAARVQVYEYAKPSAAIWPQADFIVGNPPFIGNKRMRENLGDGYVEALWRTYPKMPKSADLVMFWWEKAALAARIYDEKKKKGARRFGLITTNSITMTFNTRVSQPHLNASKNPLSLLFAIPDHPWVDTLNGAAVRIAMTVVAKGKRDGMLLEISSERKDDSEVEGRSVQFMSSKGKVLSNLRIGPDIQSSKKLQSNSQLCFMGVIPHGKGMVVSQATAKKLSEGRKLPSGILRPYSNGKNLTSGKMDRLVIDAFPLSEGDLRDIAPSVYQWLNDAVKPLRETNRDKDLREKWWLHRRNNQVMRNALRNLKRYIATVETSKHRFFVFVDGAVLPDQKLRVVALMDGWQISVLSSKYHTLFADAAGGRLGVGNDPVYNGTLCFDPFPFPDLTEDQKTLLRVLGEQLDAHRKRQQAAHAKLTLTQMYNVLEKLRAGEVIEGKDREIYDQGLISILRDLHDQVDTVVAEAYGWPVDISDEEILCRLVTLNKERAREESQGHIRWLRPDYQNPTGQQATKGKQTELDVGSATKIEKAPWPKTLPGQIAAVRATLQELGEATPDQIARRFIRARTTSVQPLLESLAALGQATPVENGKYIP